MSPLFVVIIPLALTMIGIMLNSFHIVHDQPAYSLDENPVDKLAAERQANFHFFQLQTARSLKRQKRIGRFGCFMLLVFFASAGWLYSDAVKATTMSKQITAIETLAVADSKETVLSLTLGDGSHVQYLVKAPETPSANAPTIEEPARQNIQKWQLANLGTAVNLGDARLPMGVALRMAH